MANIDLPPQPSEQSMFNESPRNGACLFSTHNGCFAPRYAPNYSMPCIQRGDPYGDCVQMVANLRRDFPEICAMIKKPVAYDTLYEWFDHRDAWIHGASFLLSVLSHIALQNQERLYDFVKGWRAANAEAFMSIVPNHTVEYLFTPEDKEKYSLDFLTDATAEIKRMQAIEKEQEHNRIQEQHAQMIRDQRDFVVSQAPATAPRVSVNAPRATSNPERHPSQLCPDHTRQIPPPDAQFTGPTGRLPLPRLTGATELLEHIAPGATTRGDFHSDPLATLGRPYPDTIMAIPSHGIPGPYGYITGRPIPLDERQRKFGGNMPRVKKNPMKRLSDDARRQYDADAGHRSLPNRGAPRQYPASFSPVWSQNNTQLRLTDSVNMPQVNNVSYPGHHWQGNEYQARRYPPRIEEVGTRIPALRPHPQSETSGGANEGIEFRPAADFRGTRGEANNPRHTHWAPNHESDGQRSVLANMSNTGQSQLQHTPVGRQGAGQGAFLEGGDRIWIGAIPLDFTKDMLTRLLEPCRGLRHITDPRSPPSGKSAFVFASFENPDCALEALERIPQTLFDMLPKGHKLLTNWPKTSASTRGEFKDRPAVDQSPAKSRKDSEFRSHQNHVSLTKSENRVTMSEGSPAISPKATAIEGRQSRDLVVGPDHRHSQSQSPENRGAPTVSRKTTDTLLMPSGAKPVTDKTVTKAKPTDLPIKMVAETNSSPQHKNTDTHTDASSNADTLHPNGNDGFGLGPPEKKDKAVPNQTLCPPSVDGIQETVPPSRTKHLNKKKNKPKSSKKTAAVESEILPTSQGLPDLEQTSLSAMAEADYSNDLRNDSDCAAPMKSITTGLPGPCVVSPKDNSTVENPASAPQDTGLSPLDRPKMHSIPSKSGPIDHLHSNPTKKDQMPNVKPQSLAPMAPTVPSGLDPEPGSQAMTRDTSKATENNAVSVLTSTAPSSFFTTERSNSIVEDSHLHSLNAHAASLERTKQTTAGIDPEQLRSKLEAQADATSSGTSDTAKSYIKGSQHVVDDNIKKAKSKDGVSNKASILPATPPKPQSSARNPSSSRSPGRKQAPDIPQRVSSLSVSSTPIHTRLRKKPKNFSPVVKEESGGATTQIDPAEGPSETQESEPPNRQSNISTPANTSPSAHGGSSRSNKKKRANNPKANPSTVHAPTSPTPTSKRDPLPKPEMPFHIGDEDSVAVSTPVNAQQALPKPERPFCADDGASLPVPKLNEKGQQIVTLEYRSVEDLFEHFASDLPSPGSPMTPSLASSKTIRPSSPDTQSYNSRLKRQIDEVLGQERRETTLVNEDGSVPLESQERAWGDVLSIHEYPGNPDSRTDPDKWAFWVAEFLRPNSTQPSPLIRELGMNIKYFAGTSIRYQHKLFQSVSDTSALMQEYKEGMTLVERMPGSPWAHVKPEEWERLALDFRRRLMAKYKVSFSTSTAESDEDTSMVIKSSPKGKAKQGPSASSQHSVTSVTFLLDSLKQRLDEVTKEIAHANKRGLDTSGLEFESEELQYLVKNSPLDLTSRLEPKEWEPMAFNAINEAIKPLLRDQPQKPNVTCDSTGEPSLACSSPTRDCLKGLLLTEQAAQGYSPNPDPGSDEERVIIPSLPVRTGQKTPREEPAWSSVSISSPAESADIMARQREERLIAPTHEMATCRYPATSELIEGNSQGKQTKDVVEGLQKTEMELGRGEGFGRTIAQEKTEENHDEQVSRQSDTVIVGESSEVDNAFSTDAQAVDRTTEKEGERERDSQAGAHDRKLQATHAIEPDRGRIADRELKDISIEEPNGQNQVTQEECGHTSLIDPEALAQDQRTWCTGLDSKVNREGDVSPLAEQKQVDDTDESNEQPTKKVEIREEPAESTSENKDPVTAPEDSEKPTHERKVFAALDLEVSDVKNDMETTDAKKDATTALEHTEGSTHEGEVSTSPSFGARSTPSSSNAHSTPSHSEAHSSPSNSEASGIEDNTKTPVNVNQAEASPLAAMSGGSNMCGKKTYATLAKEPASGSGSGGDKHTEAKSDPWAVPEGEPTWGRGKK